MDFATVRTETERIMRAYVALPTITGTAEERRAESFLESEIHRIPYFNEHPDHWGFKAVPDDPFGRRVFWAMVRGAGAQAVVCLHHYDVVPVDNFGEAKASAFNPENARHALERYASELGKDVAKDLASGKWLFGRGSCDMKSGGAAQLALLAQYAEEPDFPGTVIVVAVPDEENLSAGMRTAAPLLADLQQKFGLHYGLMIDSEPHARQNERTITMSIGSIGKMLVSIDVFGVPVHAGDAANGFSPIAALSRIAGRTEANLELSAQGDEVAPPPTWLQLRDGKPAYDISMPASAHGCLSVLSTGKTPAKVLDSVRSICEGALRESLEAAKRVRVELGLCPALPWKGRVMNFHELVSQARDRNGASFDQALSDQFGKVWQELAAGACTMLDANRKIVAFARGYARIDGPLVVYGLVPPFYPPVSNRNVAWRSATVEDLRIDLDAFAQMRFGLFCESEKFFMGISDMSYAQIDDAEAVQQSLRAAMPLFGRAYDLPLRAIERISMPVINIGPWGKDLHQPTERVHAENAFWVTPQLIDHAIRLTLA